MWRTGWRGGGLWDPKAYLKCHSNWEQETHSTDVSAKDQCRTWNPWKRNKVYLYLSTSIEALDIAFSLMCEIKPPEEIPRRCVREEVRGSAGKHPWGLSGWAWGFGGCSLGTWPDCSVPTGLTSLTPRTRPMRWGYCHPQLTGEETLERSVSHQVHTASRYTAGLQTYVCLTLDLTLNLSYFHGQQWSEIT